MKEKLLTIEGCYLYRETDLRAFEILRRSLQAMKPTKERPEANHTTKRVLWLRDRRQEDRETERQIGMARRRDLPPIREAVR